MSIGQWYETPHGPGRVVFRHRQKEWVFGRPQEGEWVIVELWDGRRTTVRTRDLGGFAFACVPDESGGVKEDE